MPSERAPLELADFPPSAFRAMQLRLWSGYPLRREKRERKRIHR